MNRFALATFLLLLPLLSFSSDSLQEQPVLSKGFLGTWTGELRVVHAPKHPDAPPTITYKLEIDGGESRVFLMAEEWQEIPLPAVISAAPTHAVLAVSDVQEYWVEDFVIHLVLLSENRMAAYVSRVVDNFRADADSSHRHFPVYVVGELTKEDN